jgi:DNA invertase Pin-like site-specific DNA recombinase
MSSSYQKELRKLKNEALKQGWREAEKKAGWMLYSPDGVTKVMIHKTASDHRALDNLVSEMRSGGFEPGG